MKNFPERSLTLRIPARESRDSTACKTFSPSRFSRSGLLGAVLLALTFALTPAARAQWETVTYNLHGGWNAIYLHGDATYATPDVLFSATPFPGNTVVQEVWRWNPNPTQTQFEASPLIPTAGTADWSVWTRGATTGNTLSSLAGQNAYLIRCSGTASDNLTVQITQKTLPPRGTWVRNGANLLGFPSATPAPSFPSYFATFPAAISSNTRLYRYVGGELGPNNPELIFSPLSRNVDRNQAYWFEAPVVSTFYGPLEFSLSNLEGLSYGRAGSIITVRVRNRTNAAITVTIAPVASDSAPAGQPPVTGPVPLTILTSAPGALPPVYTAIATGFNRVIGPQSTITLEFGIDRTGMTAAPGAFYASLLRFTDSGGLTDVRLPASALVPSLSGLWVGDVTVSDVANQSPARYHTCVVRRTEGATFTEVTSRAARVGVNTLAPLTIPPGTGALSYRWKKNGVDLTENATGATLVLSSAEAALSGAFGTTTARSAPLRTIVHIGESGTGRLLSQIFMGKLAANEQLGLATTEGKLLSTSKANASRLVAVHLPPGTDEALVATVGGGNAVAIGKTVTCTVSLDFRNPANPFVHTYHPDHDNKDARGNALGEGDESYTVTRVCTFEFTESLPGVSSVGWGTSVLGGKYTEVITGLHKAPLAVSGTFLIRRVSEIGAIATN